jgi:hypothetical protein
MLTPEVMGAVCLVSLWTAALLVALAAWQDARDLLRLLARARRALPGVVESGKATWRLSQRGRALDAKAPAIAFHDRAFEAVMSDVTVRADGGLYRVPSTSQVWPSDEARRRATACPDAPLFDDVYRDAVKAAGHLREVKIELSPGDAVWVLGKVREGQVHGDGEPVVLAAFDPRGYLGKRAALLSAFIPVELALCACVTRVALTLPHFGTVSTVGAVLGLAFFLGVTPIGVALRDWARRPNNAYVRGEWKRPAMSYNLSS